MARRRKKQEDGIELLIKAGFGVLILLALAGGGLVGFAERLMGLVILAFLILAALAAIAGIIFVIKKTDWSHSIRNTSTSLQEEAIADIPFVWTHFEILNHLQEIDWYQFEKFCAAILEAESFEVRRQGGASPDGGVDLIAQKKQTKTLIQCKHWKTWKIREPVIRQLLGSMVDFNVNKGAVFFSGDCTEPAKEFATKHGIGLVDGKALAERALKSLPPEALNSILKCKDHHCPKCDSIMIWRTGDFKPFWGCSRFPNCRGVLKHSGPK